MMTAPTPVKPGNANIVIVPVFKEKEFYFWRVEIDNEEAGVGTGISYEDAIARARSCAENASPEISGIHYDQSALTGEAG